MSPDIQKPTYQGTIIYDQQAALQGVESLITLEVTLLQILEKVSFFFLNILTTVFLISCRPANVSDGGSNGLK